MSFQATFTYVMACTAMSIGQIRTLYNPAMPESEWSHAGYLLSSTVDEEAVVVRDRRTLLL